MQSIHAVVCPRCLAPLSADNYVLFVNSLPFKLQWRHGYIYKSGQCHPGLTYAFLIYDIRTLAVRAERQSARMPEIENVG